MSTKSKVVICKFLIGLVIGFGYFTPSEAAEVLPLELRKSLGKRQIRLEKVAPHYSRFFEYLPQTDISGKYLRRVYKWVEIDPRLEVSKNFNSVQRECWFAISTGAKDCDLNEVLKIRHEIQSNNFALENDLLQTSRDLVERVGLRRTRDLMIDALAAYDQSKGAFEQRAIYARQNLDYIFSDSLLNIPVEKRNRVGIFFALGYGHDAGLPSNIVRQLIFRARELGYYAKAFDTPPRGSTPINSQIINDSLKEDMPKVDFFVLVGASKGGHELSHFFLKHLPDWTMEERLKLRILLAMSPVIRSSYIADWIDTAPGLRMDLLRHISRLITKESKNREGMRSTRIDYWKDFDVQNLPQMHPNFVWINFSMLPSGEDGHVEESAILSKFSRHAMKYLKNRGPTDGLVETAATILPPDSGVRQWILRGLGSHLPTFGKFVDGTPIANIGNGSEVEAINSGSGTMDLILRVLPQNPEAF